MPPKKKKSGKKKKGKKSARKSARPTNVGDALSDMGKEFFLVQIRDLENRLVRYQKKCDMLEVMNGQFTDQYNQMSTDKKEIVAFLKKSLEQRADEIADLNDRLVGLQQAKENEKDTYEQQLQALRTEFNETKDQLTQENVILGSKLSSLEEFKFQKESLMNKLAGMEQELEKQQIDHKDILYNLERKAVVDKDRLKKEMVMRVNQVAAEFRKVSNKQMAETTKRTIRENVSINAQLTKMSDKTMELIQENDELKMKEKKQRQDIELLEANEKELARKNHSNQKIIKMLTEKCKTQEAMIAEYEMRDQEYQEMDGESEILKQQVESTREELMSLGKENEQLQDDLDGSKDEMKTVKKKNSKLEKVVTEAALALKVCLTDTPEAWDGSTKYDEEEKRDSLMEHLLLLLNSAAAIGVGPSPGDMGRQVVVKRSKSALSEMPGSRSGSRKGTLSPLSKMPGGALPHYQLGDLGLIPRPQKHMETKAQKMKELSRTTQLGSLRKVLTKSVGIQTMSAPKAMFFADQLLSRTTPTAQTALLTGITPNLSRKSTAKSMAEKLASRKMPLYT